MTLVHILFQRFNVVPRAGDLHQPMEIIVNATGIGLVDLDHWQKVLVRHQHLVFVVEQTAEKNAAAQVLLELAGRREQLLDRRLLLVVATLKRRRLLAVLRAAHVAEQIVELLKAAGEPGNAAVDVAPAFFWERKK